MHACLLGERASGREAHEGWRAWTSWRRRASDEYNLASPIDASAPMRSDVEQSPVRPARRQPFARLLHHPEGHNRRA